MKFVGCAGVVLCATLIFAAPALAAPHEVRIPLRDGRLHTPDLAAAVCREMHLPTCNFSGGDIDMSSLGGSLFVRAVNRALGDGCRITLDRDALVLHADPEKLPGNCDDANRAVRLFTAEMTPEATARQAKRWGLFLPAYVTDKQPLVVMIHGLDSEKGELSGLGDLIQSAGYQVAYFSYPDDQPISESAEFFATKMIDLRRQFPALKVDFVAHSMGGLVARAYIEGDRYAGGVNHLLLVGTPNAGSKWAACRCLLEIKEQYQQWRHDPEWSWTWSITDGLGEAGRDLKPGSKFLKHLNSLPRRASVKYTIIAGMQHPASRISAEVADATSSIVPKRAERWWGFRQCKSGLASCANYFRHTTGAGDGPVKIDSARLAGVTDVAMIHADHLTLVCYHHGNPPAAWAVIQDRLAK